MLIKKRIIEGKGIKFSREINRKEIARAFLYILHNDLHKQPFGFLEDVFVDESFRGKGIGTAILNKVMKEAKKQRCYKIVATSRYSRPEAHRLYKRLCFKDWGKEFRLDL
jgi:GNAT superfamily N-acetyltransferase